MTQVKHALLRARAAGSPENMKKQKNRIESTKEMPLLLLGTADEDDKNATASELEEEAVGRWLEALGEADPPEDDDDDDG
jgi:hypothetical protein